MKNIKTLVIICIIVLNCLGWYTQFSGSIEDVKEYDTTLQRAQELEEKKLFKKSIQAYKEVLSEEDSIDIRIKVYELYKEAYKNFEIEESEGYQLIAGWLENLIQYYKYDAKSYEIAAQYYYDLEDYTNVNEILLLAEKREIVSESLEKMVEDIRYLYQGNQLAFSEVYEERNGIYLIHFNNKYAYYSMEDGIVLEEYDYLTPFSDGYALGKKDNYTYLLDEAGERVCYFDNKVTEAASVGQGLIACKSDGVYSYYNLKGEKLFGAYDYAGKFTNGIAAVCEKGKWKLINSEGTAIGTEEYEDIKCNELDECVSNGIIFAKSNGKYYMLNENLNKIGNFNCDDVDLFRDGLAAFSQNGKWGYVDNTGNIVIEPQYEEAKSFSGGYAGVKANGKWGFINTKQEMVIQPAFEDTLYFMETSCFVKENGIWDMINFYYTGGR